ncbi:MAG TPA: hypothetical protein VG273_06530 [Bryobacteraceae bacterium]|nr:hypothetical protein [Bryobacteraceae bacterium]
MHKKLSIFLLGAALAVPFAVTAQDHQDQRDQDRTRNEASADHNDNRAQQNKRYYDKKTRQYHEWNQDEDRRYRDYLTEHHMKYRDFDKLKSNQQSDYFSWSSSHH